MCGITGIFEPQRQLIPDQDLLEAMVASLVHRGPDGMGIHRAPGFALGHRRLSIVDLAMGSQPMSTSDGQFWVTYNGEIYNHESLRQELTALGHQFQTRSDTEVLLHGYRQWGRDLPTRLRGMFAFAIVDVERHELFAARDRLGKKPFYYADSGKRLSFASEVKALLQDPQLSRELDAESLGQYLCLGYVPDPGSMFKGIRQLPPASCLLVNSKSAKVWSYWKLAFSDRAASEKGAKAEDYHEELLACLDESVRIRLMGEVPLGAFLSGGVDSYAVVESMSRASSKPVQACSMGFDNPEYDERPMARAAATACGADLLEQVVGVEEMLQLDWFDQIFDEPFADSSAIPTYHVSRLARQKVTVALSGDGGDESFAGYRRYRFDVLENRVRRFLPANLWSLLGAIYPKADYLPQMFRFKRTLQNLGCKPAEAYARSVSFALPEQVDRLLRPDWRGGDPFAPLRSAYENANAWHPLQRAMATDYATYLPGDILTKVDRASMAVSLEVRCPLLDHHMIELAARVPPDLHLARDSGKVVLRSALRHRLGKEALNRPKRGFSVPLKQWMQGDLGRALVDAAANGPLSQCLDVDAITSVINQHRRGLRDHSHLCWTLLVLHRFLQRWGS